MTPPTMPKESRLVPMFGLGPRVNLSTVYFDPSPATERIIVGDSEGEEVYEVVKPVERDQPI